MPIYQKLLDFDTEISMLPDAPVIINDIDIESEDDRNYIDNLISTKYSDDLVDLIPSCECGELKGEFSSTITCPTCHKPVKSSLEDDIKPLLWFRKPNNIHKLINPMVLMMLFDRFTKSGFNAINYLIDSNYKPNPNSKNPAILRMKEDQLPRSYNNFIEDFDNIMDYLFNLPVFRLKRGTVDYLYEIIKGDKRYIFSDYIPLPNRSFFIIERRVTGVYVDPLVIDGVDAIKNLLVLDNNLLNVSQKVVENRTAKALIKLCDYYKNYITTKLPTKKGLFRKHVYGTRANYTYRTVITSLTEKHMYDEVHVPWGIGLTAFRLHLMNKLKKLGISHNNAVGLLLGHVHLYNDILDRLLKELIEESEGGIPILFGRNPSLLSGSLKLMRITKFKTDITDNTTSLGLESVVSYNADFDGDFKIGQ